MGLNCSAHPRFRRRSGRCSPRERTRIAAFDASHGKKRPSLQTPSDFYSQNRWCDARWLPRAARTLEGMNCRVKPNAFTACTHIAHGQGWCRARATERRSALHRPRTFLTVWTAVLALAMIALPSSPSLSETAKALRIGTQFGLGYLPLYVADQAHLFEKRMREQGIAPVPVEIVHVAGGPQINDGLLSGNFEIGSGGYTAMMVSW